MQRHRIRKYPDSTVHMYPKKYRIEKFPLWRADSKVSGFAGRIHRMRAGTKGVSGKKSIRIQKYPDTVTCGGATDLFKNFRIDF